MCEFERMCENSYFAVDLFLTQYLSRTYSYDVILAEAKLIIIVAFKVQQGLRPSSSVPCNIDIVLKVLSVALHCIVGLQGLMGI